MKRSVPLLTAGLLVALALPALSQVEDSVCVLCHQETRPPDGDETPRAHLDLSCVECHVALFDSDVEEEFEHQLDLPPVNCTVCHGDQVEELAASVHAPGATPDGRPYPTCTECHGSGHFLPTFEGLAPAERSAAKSRACAACHEKDLAGFHASTHGTLLAAGDPRAPSCSDCHDAHAARSPSDPASSVSVDHVSERCEACHTDARRSIHHRPGEAPAGVSCTVCHFGHSTSVEDLHARITDEGGVNKCAYCHSGQHEGDTLAHGSRLREAAGGGKLRCNECHTFHWDVEGDESVAPQMDCGGCHEEQREAYSRSAHSRSREAGNLEPPDCRTCHGDHDVPLTEVAFADDGAKVKLCSDCHADTELMLSFDVNPHVVTGFKDTYHGKLYDILNTGKNFAVCSDCHGYHDVLEPEDPESRVNRARIVETCRECHAEANEKFVSYLVHPIQLSEEERVRVAALAGTRSPLPPRDGVERDGSAGPPEGNGYATLFHLVNVSMKLLFASVMTFFILHTLLWFHRGARQRKTRKYYKRFSAYDRMLHVMVNISFLTLAFTGLPQTFAHTTMGAWILENIVSLELAQELHYWAAAVTGLYFVLHLGQVARNGMKNGWKRIFTGPDSLVPRKKDWDDFVQHVRWFLNRGERPRFDRWTYWEKFDYLAVFWGVFVIGLSGVIRWKEEFFGNLFGGGLVSIATTVHEEEALLATAFIFTVHFFNTHLRREKFPMDMSIYTGVVSEHELSEERPMQYERMVAAGTLDEAEVAPRRAYVVVLSYLWGTLALGVGLTLLVLIVLGLISEGL